MIPFALALGATPFHIGVIGAVPFLGRIAQIALAGWVDRVGARTAALVAGLLDRLFIAAVASLPFWLENPALAPWMLVAFLIGAGLAGELYTVATSIWHAERVAAGDLGRFVARKTVWANWTGLTAALCAGLLAESLIQNAAPEMRPRLIAGVLLCGCVVGVLGILVVRRVRPHSEFQANRHIGNLRETARRAWADPRLRRFIVYTLCWGFAVNLSSAFYVAYAVKGLGFGVAETALLGALHLAVAAIFVPFWGRVSDRYGNRPILLGCGFWAAMIPFLWAVLVAPGRGYAGFGIELISGAAWGGINLAASNLLLKMIPPKERVHTVAFFTAVTGSIVFLSPILGGILVSALQWKGIGFAYKTLFVISGVLRMSSLFILQGVIEPGAKSLPESVRVLNRSGPQGFSAAGMGVALLWVPIVVETVRRKTLRAGQNMGRRVTGSVKRSGGEEPGSEDNLRRPSE